MAALADRLSDLAGRIATETKALRTLINGNVANLNGLATTNKSTLVTAINEVNAAAKITVVEVDFGYPALRQRFVTIAVPGLTAASRVVAIQVGGPVTGKGSDESEAEPLDVHAKAGVDTLRITTTAQSGRFGGRALIAYKVA